MVRITLIMLCFLLAAAAAGRYQAEVSVRETRNEIDRLDQAKAQEMSDLQVLRAEIAYLESPERLARIAEKVTALRSLDSGQLMTADEFLIAYGRGEQERLNDEPAQENDVILHAIAMADLVLAE